MANAVQDGLPLASTDDIAQFATQSYASLADVVVEVHFLGLVAGRDPALAGLVDEATARSRCSQAATSFCRPRQHRSVIRM